MIFPVKIAVVWIVLHRRNIFDRRERCRKPTFFGVGKIIHHQTQCIRLCQVGKLLCHDGDSLFHRGGIRKIGRHIFIDVYLRDQNGAKSCNGGNNRQNDISVLNNERCNSFHTRFPPLFGRVKDVCAGKVYQHLVALSTNSIPQLDDITTLFKATPHKSWRTPCLNLFPSCCTKIS